jgi:hypothetical protein
MNLKAAIHIDILQHQLEAFGRLLAQLQQARKTLDLVVFSREGSRPQDQLWADSFQHSRAVQSYRFLQLQPDSCYIDLLRLQPQLIVDYPLLFEFEFAGDVLRVAVTGVLFRDRKQTLTLLLNKHLDLSISSLD